MPRKSTASISSIADPPGPSILSPSSNMGPNMDGDASMLSNGADAATHPKSAKTTTRAEKGDADTQGIDDLLLPRTLTSRLARGILPPNTSIQKDALLALTKAGSVFISYLASHANEMTQKKTINPQDVLKAIHEIEMSGVMGLGVIGPDGKVGGRLEKELEVWETVVRGKRKGYRDKVKARDSGAGVGEGGTDDPAGENDPMEDHDGERDAKRAKVEEAEQSRSYTGTTSAQHDGHGHGGPSAFATPDQSHEHPRDPNGRPPIDGVAHDMVNDTDHDDPGEDDPYDEESPEDETQADEEDEPEDNDEPGRDDDDLDSYGPDDQLRHDMNGEESAEDSE